MKGKTKMLEIKKVTLDELPTNGWTPYEYKVLHQHISNDWKVLANGINKWIAQGRPQIVADPNQTWLMAMELYKLGEK